MTESFTSLEKDGDWHAPFLQDFKCIMDICVKNNKYIVIITKCFINDLEDLVLTLWEKS